MNRSEEWLEAHRTNLTEPRRPDCRKCRDYGGWWVNDGPLMGEWWLDCPACQQVKR